MDLRAVAYEPGGERLGVLPDVLEMTLTVPVADTPTLALSYPGTGGVRGHLLDGQVEVAVEADTGTGWREVPGARFISQKTEGDLLDDGTSARKLDAVHVSSLLGEALVWDVPEASRDKDGKWSFLSANPGVIIRSVWDQATQRGWGQGLTLDATTAKDSAGKPWASVVTIAYEKTITLSQVVASLVDLGMIDVSWDGRTMLVYNADTALARKRTDVVWPLRAGSTTAAPEATTWADLATHVLVKGEGGRSWVIDNPGAPAGRRIERVVEAGGVETEATARLVARAALASGATPALEVRREWVADGALLLPWRDYQVGDWISVERAGGLEVLRVAQVSVTKNADGISGHTTLGTRLDDTLSRLAKKTKGIVGGASTSGAGVRPAPEGPDRRTPAAPGGLVVQADSVEMDDGRMVGVLDITWAAVTTATDGTALEVASYEVDARENVTGAPWRRVDTCEDTDSQVTGWRVGQAVAVRVRARGRYATTPGAWSTTRVVTIPVPQKLDPPTALASSVNNGIVTVEWDGRLQAPGGKPYAPPRRFDHLVIEEAIGSTGPWKTAGKIPGGSLTLDRQDVIGQTRYYRARAVDWRGTSSDPSPVTQVLVDSEVVRILDAQAQKAQETADTASAARTTAEQALAQSQRVSDVEAKAQDAWNKAVAALAEAPDLAAPWTDNWYAGSLYRVTPSQMTISSEESSDDTYSVRFGCYPLPAFAARTGRTYRYEVVLSSTAAATINFGMYYMNSAGEYVRSYWPSGNQKSVPAGAVRIALGQLLTPSFTDEAPRAQFVSYVHSGGGTVTIHSARVVDVTDVAEALTAAQAAQDAASSATTAATRAQATADSRNTITRSTKTPSGRGSAPGDVWWRYGSSSLSGAIIGQWTWDGSRWQPATIGSEIVASLTADKIQAGVGQLDTGFVTDMVNHRTFTDALYTSRISVAGGNLFPDPHFEDDDGWAASVFQRVGAENNSGVVNRRYLRINETSTSQQGGYYRDGGRSVVMEPGETYHVRAKVYAGGTGAVAGMGVKITFRGKNASGVYQYPNVKLNVPSTGRWHTLEADVTYYDTLVTAADVGIHSVATYVAGAFVAVADIQVTRKVGAVLIEDGAITTPKLYVTSDMTAKIARLLKVTAGMVEAGAITAKALAVDALDGKVIRSTIIEGGTITGTRVRTGSSGERIELGTGADLTGYDGNGVRRVHMDGSTITLHSTDGGEAWRMYAGKDSSGWYETIMKSAISQGKMSLIRAGRTVYDGVDSAYLQARIVGTDWSQGNSPHMTLYGEGAFYLGGARGSVQLRNSSGELRIYSSAGLIGLYGLPTTSSSSGWLQVIQGASGMWSLYRNTSLARAKVGIEDLSSAVPDPYAVLALTERTFQDRTWTEHYLAGLEATQQRREGLTPPERLAQWEGTTPPPTLVGVIAEEVEATGLPGLCSYDETGGLTGVQYDRLAVYLLAAVRALKKDHDRLAETVASLKE